MRPGEPSRTAYGAATHRAVHQDVEGGSVFADPLAWSILGAAVDRSRALADAPLRRPLRLFIAVRHRFAEDGVAAAYARGTRQVVVLGAGLDTFAYRQPHPGLHVLEVDHPDTGAWKQQRLAEAGIAVPEGVGFVGVDFEHDDLAERLAAGGLDLDAATTFLWLGVVPYLSDAAITATLRVVAAVPGAEVVLDYPARGPVDDPALREVRADLERRTEAAGEPLRTALDPDELAGRLRSLGLDEVEDLGRDEFVPRYFGVPAPTPSSSLSSSPSSAAVRSGRRGGGHVVRARRTA